MQLSGTNRYCFADSSLSQPSYSKGSVERRKLQEALDRLKKRSPVKVPLSIGGQEVRIQCNLRRSMLIHITDRKLQAPDSSQSFKPWCSAGILHAREWRASRASNRKSSGGEGSMAKHAIRRKSCYLLEGRRACLDEVQIRHYGGNNARTV